MTTPLKQVYRLKCSCNEYEWGKQGSESMAARLCEKQPGWGGDGPKSNFQIDDSKPYAEMWMGTYPELPSYVADTGEDLQAVIDRHPKELIGPEVTSKFGHSKLPYLPKVLSISKALPLQIHPNKDVAAKLHKEDPNQFTDPNHKPEIALALSKFEAFCGFKPLDEISQLVALDPLKQFVPKNNGFSNDTLREVVRNMLNASKESVRDVYKALVSMPESKFAQSSFIPKLAPRLAEQYGETDPGILVALITMNYLVLEAGESIYIPADGIHAYLAGDIIECMARSNNVLNTGFCPRADRNNIDLFCSCVTFSPHTAEACMLRPKAYPKAKNQKTKLFAPPLNEFHILETELKAGEKETLGAIGGPSMMIATKGSAKMSAAGEEFNLNEGAVFFVAPGNELELNSKDGLLLHTAIVEGDTK